MCNIIHKKKEIQSNTHAAYKKKQNKKHKYKLMDSITSTEDMKKIDTLLSDEVYIVRGMHRHQNKNNHNNNHNSHNNHNNNDSQNLNSDINQNVLITKNDHHIHQGLNRFGNQTLMTLNNNNNNTMFSKGQSSDRNRHRYSAIQKWIKDECKRGVILKKEKMKRLKTEAQMARIEARETYDNRLKEIRHIQNIEEQKIDVWYRKVHSDIVKYEQSVSSQYLQQF